MALSTASIEPPPASQTEGKLPLFSLTAMVIGSMIGAGIFSLPRTFGAATGPFGAIIAWIIAGGGMYMLARVFQSLAERNPDLDAGVCGYVRAGFGDYPGFLSCNGGVSYWEIKSPLTAFFPIFGEDDKRPSNRRGKLPLLSVDIAALHVGEVSGGSE